MHVKINNCDISETAEFSNKNFINDVHAFNAPEIINEKVDVYAFGVIMHYILTGLLQNEILKQSEMKIFESSNPVTKPFLANTNFWSKRYSICSKYGFNLSFNIILLSIILLLSFSIGELFAIRDRITTFKYFHFTLF